MLKRLRLLCCSFDDLRCLGGIGERTASRGGILLTFGVATCTSMSLSSDESSDDSYFSGILIMGSRVGIWLPWFMAFVHTSIFPLKLKSMRCATFVWRDPLRTPYQSGNLSAIVSPCTTRDA